MVCNDNICTDYCPESGMCHNTTKGNTPINTTGNNGQPCMVTNRSCPMFMIGSQLWRIEDYLKYIKSNPVPGQQSPAPSQVNPQAQPQQPNINFPGFFPNILKTGSTAKPGTTKTVNPNTSNSKQTQYTVNTSINNTTKQVGTTNTSTTIGDSSVPNNNNAIGGIDVVDGNNNNKQNGNEDINGIDGTNAKSESSNVLSIGIVSLALIVAVAFGFIYYKKKKNKRNSIKENLDPVYRESIYTATPIYNEDRKSTRSIGNTSLVENSNMEYQNVAISSYYDQMIDSNQNVNPYYNNPFDDKNANTSANNPFENPNIVVINSNDNISVKSKNQKSPTLNQETFNVDSRSVKSGKELPSSENLGGEGYPITTKRFSSCSNNLRNSKASDSKDIVNINNSMTTDNNSFCISPINHGVSVEINNSVCTTNDESQNGPLPISAQLTSTPILADERNQKTISMLISEYSPDNAYIARFKYVPTLEDEMEIECEDVVYVKEIFNDGWSYGENVTKKTAGIFPINRLDPLSKIV